MPYLDELCAIEQELNPGSTLNSHSSSRPYFDLIPRPGKRSRHASHEDVNVENYLYRQLVQTESVRHSREAVIGELSLHFADERSRGCEPEASTALKELAVLLRQRDAALAEREATLRQQDATLREQDATLRERNAALVKRDAAIGALQVREAQLSRRLARLEHELASMKDSLSWTITAPLRKVTNLVINAMHRLFNKNSGQSGGGAASVLSRK